ncbi:MAG: cbb3-type cytochrome c oxidase N-terminal domain-containing protein, partial [Bacteroidota bacterium]
LVFLLGLSIIAWAMVMLVLLYNKSLKIEMHKLYKERGIPVAEQSIDPLSENVFTWLRRKLTNSVPIEKEADVMLDHNYDGIRELDNSLPPWWVAMFYISIVVSVVYMGYYHVMDNGLLQEEAYAVEMERAEKFKAAFVAAQANRVNENNVEALLGAADLDLGKQVYTSFCVACHGTLGEGGVGPNLTDDYWLHGGDIKAVFKTIKYGVPEKGMIPWQDQMPAADMHRVASYIMTLVGTTPPNGKAPQGKKWLPATSESSDSTATPIGMK